ncbi:MAG TPA: metallopeptidase TldD-related protein [Dictyoglomaceae bacterium]|nr:metallopeptidase TldD-related protein [Dictyoglomaceae bacterium]
MWGKDRALEFLKKVIDELPFEKKEVSLFISSQDLTRFANNVIHQNVAEDNLTLFVRVGEGKKKVVLSTSNIEEDSIKSLPKNIKILMESQPETEELYLPEPEEIPPYPVNIFEPSPEKRAEIVKKFIEKGENRNLETFGAITEEIDELVVVNSQGVEAYGILSYGHGKVMYMGDGSGYQEEAGKDIHSIDFEELSERALEKCLNSKNPQDIEPGMYTVILEPLAVAEMLGQLSYFSFNAKSVQEKRSFMTFSLGQKILSEKVSIYDDGYDPKGIIYPIDFEGVPKKHVDIIKNGVVIGPVYDTATSIKDGKKSTGHALPPTSSSWGPFPSNLFLVSGDKSLEDIIAGTERGILVTRFHYVNAFLDPVRVLGTGMTRDGTFLIENGKIQKSLKNMRFTQSFVEALSKVLEISKESVLVPIDVGFARVPTLKIEDFNFTGKTEF